MYLIGSDMFPIHRYNETVQSSSAIHGNSSVEVSHQGSSVEARRNKKEREEKKKKAKGRQGGVNELLEREKKRENDGSM